MPVATPVKRERAPALSLPRSPSPNSESLFNGETGSQTHGRNSPMAPEQMPKSEAADDNPSHPPNPPAGLADPDLDDEFITLRLKESARYQRETEVQVRRTEQLRHMMDAYAARLESTREQLRFIMHDGHRINSDETAEDLELENGDVIDVIEEQLGGGLQYQYSEQQSHRQSSAAVSTAVVIIQSD
ncbi:putative Ubiquitin-like domain-containing protein [Seiridium cardinale]